MNEKERDACRRRVISIIKTQALLYNDPWFDLKEEEDYDYRSLIDFAENPDNNRIKRIISLVQAQELYRAAGIFAASPEEEGETEQLLDYLHSLEVRQTRKRSDRNLNKKNLGLSFLRKGYGLPLFGYRRPEKIPKGGIILCVESGTTDENTLISASVRDEKTDLSYQDLGLLLSSRGKWLHCLIHDSSKQPDHHLIRGYFQKDFTVHSFSVNTIIRKNSLQTVKLNRESFDPLEDRYVYYFLTIDAGKKISRYLSSRFSGVYRIPLRESESIAIEFTQTLLQR